MIHSELTSMGTKLLYHYIYTNVESLFLALKNCMDESQSLFRSISQLSSVHNLTSFETPLNLGIEQQSVGSPGVRLCILDH